MKNWFKRLSLTGKIAVVSTAALLSIGIISASAQQGNNSPSPATVNTVLKPVVTTKTISETEEIKFTSSNIDSNYLDKGKTQTKTAGVNGVRTRTYEVKYENGIEVSRTEKSNEITTQPVNEVIEIGTREPEPVCENGSYINSSGNRVCSPASSPAGATAKCADGTYSYSQSRRGTCSHHGGVAEWL